MLPHRRLAGFYFFYFGYVGAFAPFLSVYLEDRGYSPLQIGTLMALPPVTRTLAPHLWGWLADAGAGRMRVARATALAATVCWLGMFAPGGVLATGAAILAMTFFASSVLP